MCLACCFVLIDAQTIQMCLAQDKDVKANSSSRRKPQQGGSLGRQFVMSALAQAIISPIVGQLMDVVSRSTGKPNYLVPFMGNVFFLVLTILMVCCIKLDVSLPKSEGIKVLYRTVRHTSRQN